jgi:transcriptional regulator with XRE-family HTH domain
MTDREIALFVGARLREARKRAGLSLHQVQEQSGGVWRAVVVGSYERGDRNPTLVRLIQLAQWYGEPPAALLPDWQGELTEAERAVQVQELLAEAVRIVSQRAEVTG